jgi:alkanesulfonate monooxygenase SsuD/methylene tetrahydromethanopterin reductase-like flavin-dependent oxidoreductase (luciferase family)
MTDIRERGHPIRFGINTPQMWRSWDDMLGLWSRAEVAGWDAAFVVDHFLSDWEGEMGAQLEAFTLLAALAREVPRIDFGVYVASVTHKPAAVLAKQAVTLDHLSNGRFILGIGAGWNEREHEAYGIPFPSPSERVDLVGETLEAIRLLESQEVTDYEGTQVRLSRAPFEPKPVNGRMRILIGSRRPRMLGHLARYGDLWDSAGPVDKVMADGAALDRACAEVGRDPDEIVWMHEEIARGEHATVDGLRARVAALAPLGVSFFLVNVWPRSDPSVIEDLGVALPGLRQQWNASPGSSKGSGRDHGATRG